MMVRDLEPKVPLCPFSPDKRVSGRRAWLTAKSRIVGHSEAIHMSEMSPWRRMTNLTVATPAR
jgi:hypothetical protein